MQQSAFGGLSSDPENRSLVSSAARPLDDEEMILAIDGHATDRTDRPVLGHRLGERRVVLENRNLHALRLRNDVVARSRPECDETHDDCPNDSRPIHTPPLC